MAVMYAMALKECGHDVFVWKAPQYLRDQVSVGNVETLTTAEGFDVLVVGGGAFLATPPLNRPQYWLDIFGDLERVTEMFTEQGLPIYFSSIGGNGDESASLLSLEQWTAFHSLSVTFVTTRLKGDLDFLRRIVKSAEYYPDVVLGHTSYWGIQTVKDDHKPQIGLNIRKNCLPSTVLKAVELIGRMCGVTLVYIQTHVRGSGHDYEFVGGADEKNISYDGDLTSFLCEISRLDFVISCKLHLGVVAQGFGNCFVSFRGPPKAKSYLRDLGLGEFVIESRKKLIFHLLRLLLSKNHRALRKFESREKVTDEYIADSQKHIDVLLHRLSIHGGSGD